MDIMTALRESIEKTKAQKKPMEKAKGKKEAARRTGRGQTGEAKKGGIALQKLEFPTADGRILERMAQILKFPGRAAKFGFKRVPKRKRRDDNPAQLHLFAQGTAQILQFESPLSHFEHALLLDERGDPQATEHYRKAIAEQDCIADAYCNLGIIESKQGRTTKAFDCFTNSLKHDAAAFRGALQLGQYVFRGERLPFGADCTMRWRWKWIRRSPMCISTWRWCCPSTTNCERRFRR